jgi:hypothetical protein
MTLIQMRSLLVTALVTAATLSCSDVPPRLDLTPNYIDDTTCSQQTDGTPCTTDNLCIVGEECLGGFCQGGTAATCDNSNQCKVTQCTDPKNGCFSTNKSQGTACNDGNGCTKDDVCNGGGICEGTIDPGFGCDDKDPCTKNDTCDGAGLCKGTEDACDDGNKCTNDICDSQKGCQYTFNSLSCDDNDKCTYPDSCNPVNGECVGEAKGCDEGKADCPDDLDEDKDWCFNGDSACVQLTPADFCPDDGNCLTESICSEKGFCKTVDISPAPTDCIPCISDEDCFETSFTSAGTTCNSKTCENDQCLQTPITDCSNQALCGVWGLKNTMPECPVKLLIYKDAKSFAGPTTFPTSLTFTVSYDPTWMVIKSMLVDNVGIINEPASFLPTGHQVTVAEGSVSGETTVTVTINETKENTPITDAVQGVSSATVLMHASVSIKQDISQTDPQLMLFGEISATSGALPNATMKTKIENNVILVCSPLDCETQCDGKAAGSKVGDGCWETETFECPCT